MSSNAERRLKAAGIVLPPAPKPLGAYVEAVQVGSLVFVSGALPLEGGVPKFVGRLGADISIEEGRSAARLAALNALALARQHLGSLEKVQRVARLFVSLATTAEFSEHPKVADGASEVLAEVFGAELASARNVAGVTSLPKGACVVVEMILAMQP
jgi:enamine deaminase RidA (YjgF/YER057c/UK114 family)